MRTKKMLALQKNHVSTVLMGVMARGWEKSTRTCIPPSLAPDSSLRRLAREEEHADAGFLLSERAWPPPVGWKLLETCCCRLPLCDSLSVCLGPSTLLERLIVLKARTDPWSWLLAPFYKQGL
ncbi:hypothetical protein HJG60_011118 [Phyllostomus discolor]|uniref:Uncharacterized protein n=1 Tax=Phyllostomus discolor TaxID=89673 RepID=A0A834A3V5_9CHIR|nr:hypothetical protein HJG60_011118 [Phyllostomus discolor]